MLILPNKRLDFTCLRVARVLHWHAIQRHRSLWCFTGYYFIDDERSHALWRSSCAGVYTYFQLVFAIFGSACLMSFCRRCRSLWCFTGYYFIDDERSHLVGWLAGWLAGWLVGWLAGWLVGWLVGWLAGWLVGWLAGWLGGMKGRLVSMMNKKNYVGLISKKKRCDRIR